MSRKATLLQESYQLVRRMRRGSPHYREKSKQELRRFIDTLIYLGTAPPSLKHLNHQMFVEVVAYWKKQNISIDAIMNKLAMLRNVFSQATPEYSIPSNQSLNLHWQKNHRPAHN